VNPDLFPYTLNEHVPIAHLFPYTTDLFSKVADLDAVLGFCRKILWIHQHLPDTSVVVTARNLFALKSTASAIR
jgi:hypothetical protein